MNTVSESVDRLLTGFRASNNETRLSLVGNLILGFPPMSDKRIFWLNQLGSGLLSDEARLVALFQESVEYVNDLERQTP